MFAQHVPILAQILKEYYEPSEFHEIAHSFGVELVEELSPIMQWWQVITRNLVEHLEQGYNYVLLMTILEQLGIKNMAAVAYSMYENKEYHRTMQTSLERLQAVFEKAAAPSEIAAPENKPFSAKSQIREFLEKATSDVFIVDPYVGAGTLDCLRTIVSRQIRLLTGLTSVSISSGFDSALQDFNKEGFDIEVRRVDMLHDRHLVFNERCWLVGSSLKDAGKKAFNCVEILDYDCKRLVIETLEAKWANGRAYS